MWTFPTVGRLADQKDQKTENPEDESRRKDAMRQIRRMTVLIM
jgi:hypothetical protein